MPEPLRQKVIVDWDGSQLRKAERELRAFAREAENLFEKVDDEKMRIGVDSADVEKELKKALGNADLGDLEIGLDEKGLRDQIQNALSSQDFSAEVDLKAGSFSLAGEVGRGVAGNLLTAAATRSIQPRVASLADRVRSPYVQRLLRYAGDQEGGSEIPAGYIKASALALQGIASTSLSSNLYLESISKQLTDGELDVDLLEGAAAGRVGSGRSGNLLDGLDDVDIDDADLDVDHADVDLDAFSSVMGRLRGMNWGDHFQVHPELVRDDDSGGDSDDEDTGFFSNIRKAPSRVNRLTSKASDRLDDVGDKLDGILTKVDRSVDRFGVLGKGIQKFTGGVRGAFSKAKLGAVAFTAAVVAAGAVVVTGLAVALGVGTAKAIRFQEAMVEVRKTTGLTEGAMESLSDTLLSMSARTGVAREELARIASIAGQLGITGVDNIAAFTETVAKLSAVSELTAEQSANMLARISQAFDLPIEQSEALGSVLNELSNTTTATALGIADALTRVGSSAASLGVAVQDVAALSAVLIDAGIGSRRAGTMLRNVFTILTTEADRMAAQMGISAEAFRGMISEDALGALEAYLDHLRTLEAQQRNVQIAEIFGRENLMAIQAMAGGASLMAKNMGTANEAFAEATSLNAEYQRSLESVAAQWKKLSATIGAGLTALGGLLLGPLEGLLRLLNDLKMSSAELVGRFQALRREQEQLDDDLAAIATYRRLSGSFKLSARQAVLLEEAVARLAKRYPGYVSEVTEAGKATGIYADALKRAVKWKRALNLIEQRNTIEPLLARQQGRLKQLEGLRAQIEELEERGVDVSSIGTRFTITTGEDLQVLIDGLEMKAGEAERTVRDLTAAVASFFSGADGQFDADLMRWSFLAMGYSADAARRKTETFQATLEEFQATAVDFNPDWLGEYSKLMTQWGEQSGDTDPPLTDAELSHLEAARKAAGALIDQFRVAQAEGSDLARVMRELFSAQDRLREARDTLGDLPAGSDQAQTLRNEVIPAIEQKRSALKGTIADYEELQRAAQEYLDTILRRQQTDTVQAGPLDMETVGTTGEIGYDQFAGINQAYAEFSRKVANLRLKLEANVISAGEFERAMAEAAQEALSEIEPLIQSWVKLGVLTEEQAKKLKSTLGDVQSAAGGEGSEQLVEDLESMAGMVDGIARLADAFGDVDDNVRQALDATASLLMNVSKLVASGGSDPLAWIGAASSAAALVMSFGKDKEKLRELKVELAENVRALRENTKALYASAQVGSDVSSEQVEAAKQTVRDLQSNAVDEEVGFGRLADSGIGSLSGIDQTFTSLRDLLNEKVAEPGLGAFRQSEAAAAARRYLLTGEIDTGNAYQDQQIRRIVEERFGKGFVPIQERLDKFGRALGAFGDSVAGAQKATEYFGRFLDENATQSLERFTQFLLQNVDEINPKLRQALQEAQGLDLSTAAGRKRLDEIIARIAANRALYRGDLTPDELQEILSELDELQQSGEGSGEGFSSQVAVSHTITEFQANELLAYQREQVYYLGLILSALTGQKVELPRPAQPRRLEPVPAPARPPMPILKVDPQPAVRAVLRRLPRRTPRRDHGDFNRLLERRLQPERGLTLNATFNGVTSGRQIAQELESYLKRRL